MLVTELLSWADLEARNSLDNYTYNGKNMASSIEEKMLSTQRTDLTRMQIRVYSTIFMHNILFLINCQTEKDGRTRKMGNG